MMSFGVYYNNDLIGTFVNELCAMRYIRKEIRRDINAIPDLFGIKQLWGIKNEQARNDKGNKKISKYLLWWFGTGPKWRRAKYGNTTAMG